MKTNTAVYHNNTSKGQDMYIHIPFDKTNWLDVVLDGISSENGLKAARFGASQIVQNAQPEPDSFNALLININNRLYQEHIGGTTILATLVNHDTLYSFNAGDSPGFLYRGEEIIELSTNDGISKESNVVRNALGAQSVEIHSKQFQVKDDMRYVLMTDGIAKFLNGDDIKKILSRTSVTQSLRTLESKISDEEKMGRDDETAIIRYF